MTILVATTVAPWKCGSGEETAWLDCAEALSDSVEGDIQFFAALEVDGRGLKPYEDLFDRAHDVIDEFHFWRFALDDRESEVLSGNRLIRICQGRNLCQERAMRDHSISHILFLDSDITPPPDIIPKLLELNHPIVGANVGIYALDGPRIVPDSPVFNHLRYLPRDSSAFPDIAAHVAEVGMCTARRGFRAPEGWPVDADVRVHWNTAGCLMVDRSVFTRVAWSYDLDSGNTDDPAYQRNVRELLGFDTYVRHDVQAKHFDIPMVDVSRRDADREHVPW